MKVEVTLKTYIDIPYYILDIPEILNSDTEKEYREELGVMLNNASADIIWSRPMAAISEDCQIISAVPYEEGIDEIETLVNNWKENYKTQLDEFLSKHKLNLS